VSRGSFALTDFVGHPTLTTPQYLSAVREAADATLRLAKDRLDTGIPACPDWRMRDLIHHLGNIAYFMRVCLDTGAAEPEFTDADLPGDDDIISWVADEISHLIKAFSQADPNAPAWNWSVTGQVASFWPRCLVHEVVIHGWDAATATGHQLPIPAEVAADGVDEILTVHVPTGAARGRTFDLPGPIELRCTDTGHRWLAEPASESLRISVPTGQTQTPRSLVGTAAELYLALWNRNRDTLDLDEDQRNWVAQLSADGN
jgi:uncharacterized protein (TIGR03083 family)